MTGIGRRRKYFLHIALCIVLVMLVAACSGGGAGGSASGKAKVIRLSHNMPSDSGPDKGAQKFKEVVESKSNGALKVEIFGNSQLGSMREQTESVQLGSAEMTIQPISTLTPFISDVQIVDFPFLWPDEKVLWKVLDGPAGQMMLDSMSQAKLKGLGFWASGFKAITSNKPIQSPKDFAGMKFRVIPSPMLIAQFKAWGANPVPIDFAELYNALQQKVVDGQENPLETIYLQKYFEVQKHLTVANQGYLAYVSTMNKSFFDGLSPELQKIVIDADVEARTLGRQIALDAEADYLKKLEQGGMTVHVMTDEQKAVFRALSLPVHQEFSKTDHQKEILQAVYKAIEEAKK